MNTLVCWACNGQPMTEIIIIIQGRFLFRGEQTIKIRSRSLHKNWVVPKRNVRISKIQINTRGRSQSSFHNTVHATTYLMKLSQLRHSTMLHRIHVSGRVLLKNKSTSFPTVSSFSRHLRDILLIEVHLLA